MEKNEANGKKSLLALLIVLSMIITMPATIFTAGAKGGGTATCSDISPTYINASSDFVGIIGFAAQTNYIEGAGAYLDKVYVNFSGAGFATSDLNPLLDGATTGVSIWVDSDNPSGDGNFNSELDTMLIPSSIKWTGNQARLTLPRSIDTQFTEVNTNFTFYIVIQTSSTIIDNDIIIATIDRIWVNASNATLLGVTTAMVIADTSSPTVAQNVLIAPNGGEIWFGIQTISWNQTRITDSHLLADPITLYYSSNGGSTWTLIVTNKANNGSYSWDTTTASGDGSNYKVNITAVDDAGKIGYDISNATFQIDNTLPSCSIAYNQSSTYFKDGTKLKIYANFTESGSGINESAVNISIDTAGDGSLTNHSMSRTSNTQWYYGWAIPPGSDDDGFFTVKIWARDNASNYLIPFPTADSSRSIDNTAPFVSNATVVSPNGGERWSGTHLITWVSGDITDSHFAANPITLFYSDDGGGSWTQIATSLANSGSHSWDTTSVPDGSNYLIRILAVDLAGNIEYDVSNATFTVDNTAPVCSIAYNRSAAFLNEGMKLKIFANFTEVSTGLDEVSIRISIETSGNGSLTNTSMSKTDKTHWYYGWAIPAGSDDDGTATVKIWARDNASNYLIPFPTADSSRSIDNTAPFVSNATVVSPNGGERWSGTHLITWVSGDITDSHFAANPITLFYSDDGGGSWTQIATSLANSGSHSWDTTSVPDGSNYKIKILTVDLASNTGNDVSNATFIIDNTAPVCTIAYNRSATFLNEGMKLKIFANFTEVTAGMDEATIRISIDTAGNGSLANVSMLKSDNTHWFYGWTIPSGSDDDGFFIVKIWAQDNASNYLSPFPTTSATKRIDNTAPICAIAYNRSETYFRAGDAIKIYANFTETGSGINESTVKIDIDTAGNGGLTNTSMSRTDNTHWYYGWAIPSGSDDDGIVTVKIWARDNSSNYLNPYPTTSAMKKIDNTRPTCMIGYNRTGSSFKEGTKLKIYANFTEGSSGINQSSVLIGITTAGDGTLSPIAMFQTNNTRWYYGWAVPSGSDDDGVFTVSIWASDNESNLLNPDPTTDSSKIIDNTAPTCTIAYNRSATYFKEGDQLKIYANFTETGSGMDETSVKISIETKGNGDLANTSLSETDNTHWYYRWAIPAGADDDGVFTVKIWSLDNAGNYLIPYPTLSSTKQIDNTAPSVPTYTLTFPNGGEQISGTRTITWISGDITDLHLVANPITLFYSNNGGGSWTQLAAGEANDGSYSLNTTLISDGSDYLIMLQAADQVGNTAEDTSNATFTIDNTNPTCSIAYNQSGIYLKKGTNLKIYANFTDTASGMNESSVKMSITTTGNGGIANTSMSRTDNTHWYYGWIIPSGSNNDGIVTVKIWAQDNSSNYLNPYPTTSTTKKIDNTRPTCAIGYNHSASSLKEGTKLKIYANYTEAGSGINPSSVLIGITTAGDGTLSPIAMFQTNNTRWYYGWTVPSGSDDDGAFIVSIWASDNESNPLNPDPTTDSSKIIDNTAPTCTIAYNRSATYFKEGDQLKIYTNFTETGSGMDETSVKISIETTGNGSFANMSMSKTDNTHWYYGWTIPAGKDNDGIFSVRIYARDNMSHTLDPFPTLSDIKKIDNTNSTSSVTTFTGYWKIISPLIISYTASDPGSGSGLKNCTIYSRFSTGNQSWDGWVVKSVDSDPWTTQQWSVALSNGSGFYQFYSIAEDNASNAETPPGSADAICGYDESDPSVTITIPANNSYYDSMNQISGTCNDTGYSGVKSVNITIYNGNTNEYWNRTSHAWESGVRWISSTLGAGYATWSYNSSAVTWQDTTYYWINATVNDNATRTTSLVKRNFTFSTAGLTCTIGYNNSRGNYHYGDLVRIYANFTAPLGINEDTVHFNITTANGFYWNQSKGDSYVGQSDNTHWYFNAPIPQNIMGDNFDGVLTVKVFARDNVSNYLTPYPTSDTSKMIDNTPPIVSIEYNTTMTYFNFYPALKIYANFTEEGSGIDQTSMYLQLETHSAMTNTSLVKIDTLHYYYDWTIPNSTDDGLLTVRIFAKDNATNYLDPYPTMDTSKIIDVTAPESTVDTISGYWKKTTTTTITATSTDATSGVKQVTLNYYNSTDNSTWSGPWEFGVNGTSGYIWEFNFPNDTGYYRFYSIAVDIAGNNESKPIQNDTSCGYDYTNPISSVNGISPYWQKGNSIMVNVTATDDVSGIKNVTIYWRYKFDNYTWGEWENDTLTNSPWFIEFDSPDDGFYQFYSVARDNASNTETAPGSADAICGFDSVNPTVTISTPTNMGYYNDLSEINGTASDITSGVMNVNITIYNMTSHTYWNETSDEWESAVQWLTADGNASWSYNAIIVTWENGTEYAINATATDHASRTSSVYHVILFFDTAKPVISSVSSGTPSLTSATITWTTNENATSVVEYGTTTSYGSFSNSSIFTTSHSRPLSGLSESTTYHYRVTSADYAGNVAISTDYSFVTESAGGGGYYGGGTTTPILPIADAGGPYMGYVNEIITFNGSKSSDAGGTIVGYRWDWTNNGTYETNWSSSATATHEYTSPGVYTVRLQVRDDKNATSTDTAIVTVTIHPGISASPTILSILRTEFGLTLAIPFYANDTNGDGIIDTFTDPNHKLTVVRFVIISNDPSFLLSTDKDNTPELFWDATANTVTPVTNTPAIVENASIDQVKQEVTLEVNVQKTGWIYLVFDDSYPQGKYPDFTLSIETSDGPIPQNLLWRENGAIYVLDDPSATYRIIYRYVTLPATFQQPNGAIFEPSFSPARDAILTSIRPTFTITYFEPVTLTTVTFNNQNIGAQITSTDQKTFVYTPTSDLSGGTYQLSVTARNINGNSLTSTGEYTINPGKTTQALPWALIIVALIIAILIIIVVLVILRKYLFI